MGRAVGALGALVLGAVVHVVAFYVFVFATCNISDTADRVPAPASWQGQVCAAPPSFDVVLALGAASLLLCVGLAVRPWRTSPGRALGVTACVWLPLLALVALSVPPDSCTDGQRRDNPAWACDRTGNT